MTAWSGVLALTLVVRDEEDILGANLDYHLAQGVDVILVVDHGSTDRTPEILAEYGASGRVIVTRDEAPAHDQVKRVNQLLARAADEYSADWVIHSDADEFWMPTAGSLRDVFAAIPDRYGYIRVERRNFLPVPEDGQPFHQRMTIRERQSKNLRGHPLEPKVAQRPAAARGVMPGNHDLESPVMGLALDIGALEILHFPMRSFAQFEHKVVNTGTGYELLRDRAHGVGIDQLELLELARSGGLREYWETQVVDREHIDDALTRGVMVADERLRAFLAAGLDRRAESRSIRELLRAAWVKAGAIDDARVAAEEGIREREARLAELHSELERHLRMLDERNQLIETIRASKLMRYTAPARRIYHRFRHGMQPRR